jgi:hypothetical protein
MPGECLCNAGQRAGIGFTAPFVGFDAFPIGNNGTRRIGIGVTKDMRVAARHFVANTVDDILQAEASLFRCHLTMKHDLEKQIAQFVLERIHIATLDRIGNFISLFDCVRRDARKILFEIPRASAVRIAQLRHYRRERGNVGKFGFRHI